MQIITNKIAIIWRLSHCSMTVATSHASVAFRWQVRPVGEWCKISRNVRHLLCPGGLYGLLTEERASILGPCNFMGMNLTSGWVALVGCPAIGVRAAFAANLFSTRRMQGFSAQTDLSPLSLHPSQMNSLQTHVCLSITSWSAFKAGTWKGGLHRKCVQ